MPSWAYLLRCSDGSFYAGCTTDLDARIGRHQAGERPGYTATRRPVELAWAEEFAHLDDAIAAERRIKGWSHAKKEALIAGDWRVSGASVRVLHGRRTTTHPPRHAEEAGAAGRLEARRTIGRDLDASGQVVRASRRAAARRSSA